MKEGYCVVTVQSVCGAHLLEGTITRLKGGGGLLRVIQRLQVI